jgi:hypothetical protein
VFLISSFSVIAVQEIVDAASLKQVQFILHLTLLFVYLASCQILLMRIFFLIFYNFSKPNEIRRTTHCRVILTIILNTCLKTSKNFVNFFDRFLHLH